MAEKFFPFDSVSGDREYYAADFASYFADIISSGVSANGNNLPVTASSGLTVNVGAGFAWIKGHLYENTATKPLTLDAGDSSPRIDRVVARLDVAERKISALVVKGSPATAPTAPALVRGADYWDISLAEITVPASAVSVTSANIKDTRTDEAVCGVVRCLVETIPLAAFMEDCRGQFEEWFANLKYVLDGDVAGHLQDEIDSIRDDLDGGKYSTTAILHLHTVPGASVELTLGGDKLTATANGSGLADLYPNKLGTWTAKITTSNGTYSGSVVVENIGIFEATLPTLQDMKWADIDAVGAANAAATLFKKGDEKKIQLDGGENITLRVEDFNHDDLVSGGKAKITFGFKNLMKDTAKMNTQNTNAGGYESSEMRSITVPAILAKLPADMRAVMKPVNKKGTTGNQSTSTKTTQETLWPFSAVEVGLLTSDAGYKDEGTTYPLFVDNASRIKYLSDGTGAASLWWTRSPNTSNATIFICVSTSGSYSISSAGDSYGVCLGLCV